MEFSQKRNGQSNHFRLQPGREIEFTITKSGSQVGGRCPLAELSESPSLQTYKAEFLSWRLFLLCLIGVPFLWGGIVLLSKALMGTSVSPESDPMSSGIIAIAMGLLFCGLPIAFYAFGRSRSGSVYQFFRESDGVLAFSIYADRPSETEAIAFCRQIQEEIRNARRREVASYFGEPDPVAREIQSLAALMHSGVLTPEEFEKAKRHVLTKAQISSQPLL